MRPVDEIDLLASPVTGSIRRLAADIWRIVAPNPSALTGPGTNTYVLGTQRPVVIDPGPDDEVHLERIMEVAGGTIDLILCTHSHPDHSTGAASLRGRTGAISIRRCFGRLASVLRKLTKSSAIFWKPSSMARLLTVGSRPELIARWQSWPVRPASER